MNKNCEKKLILTFQFNVYNKLKLHHVHYNRRKEIHVFRAGSIAR